MQINPVSYNNSFRHGHFHKDNGYTVGQKSIVAGTTALGVMTACACLAKGAGYSLKPSKMFKNIKNSYLAKVDYESKEVISLGAGSCLGGLAGGYLIDKNQKNRKAKVRESVMQIGNISIPIITVTQCGKLGAKVNKTVEGLAAIGGLFIGVHLANFIMNKVSNYIFKDKTQERGVKATDFSAHVDDMVVAANCISKNKYVHTIARIVPIALTIPGYEVGTKKAETSD